LSQIHATALANTIAIESIDWRGARQSIEIHNSQVADNYGFIPMQGGLSGASELQPPRQVAWNMQQELTRKSRSKTSPCGANGADLHAIDAPQWPLAVGP